MKKFLMLVSCGILVSAACSKSAPPLAPTGLPIIEQAATPALTATSLASSTPSATPTAMTSSPTPTVELGALARPEFLAWPLPASIGVARISQYPDTAWTWNYLGLNAGYACPPMFGYLLNLDSLAYWRDLSIPEEQDRAQADPHNFEMVECYAGHHGTDIKAPAGTAVYAAADGKMQEWQLTGLNSMVVLKHCLGGTWDTGGQCLGGKQWYTTYMHLIPDESLLQENTNIVRGAQLGAIYDQTINSHLHLEVGLEKRSAANFVNPWGQDQAPWEACMWLDQSICVDANPRDSHLVFYTAEERLFLKWGDGDSVEIPSAQGLAQLRLWQGRLVAIDADANLLVWAGEATGWQTLAENVLEVQTAGQRLAILNGSRRLLLKENGLADEWLLQAEDVGAFSVSEHRIGYLAGDGNLLAKEGSLQDAWVPIAGNVLAFQLIDNRLAYLDREGNLYANEGDLLAEYQRMAGGVKAFQVANFRLGMVDTENNLFAKEGNLRAAWILQAENVTSFQLTDYRLLVLGSDGLFRLKEGNLYQDWRDLHFPGLKGAFLDAQIPVYAR